MNSSTAAFDSDGVPGAADAAAAAFVLDAQRVLASVLSVESNALSANGLLAYAAGIAGLTRLLDGAQIGNAAEIASRSDRRYGSEGLAARHGCATSAQLIEKVTGVSSRTARQQVRVAAQTGARVTDTGIPLEPLFADAGAALRTGGIGIDVADAITSILKTLPSAVPPEALRWAENTLVNQAVGVAPAGADTDEASADANEDAGGGAMPLSADLIRQQAIVYRDALDPDGAEPRDERLVELRALRFTPQPNGMLGISGQLPPAQAAIITPVFDSFLSARTGPAFPPEASEAGEPDPRSRDQQRADIFTALCEGATKLGLTPKLHGAAPTVLVTITESNLVNGVGVGVSPSTREPLAASTVRQYACDGGVQNVILGTHGEVLVLSSKDRFFTTAQRKAMIARDGPTCAEPNCNIPAYWAEAHHVIPSSRGGPTDVSNGVLLCWFHHRLLDRGEWTVTMENGRPVFHAPNWLPKRTYLSPRPRA
jgi:hypothetical protein